MSLDPESLLGIKSAVLKAAVAGTMLGVLWRREFSLAEALSSTAGFILTNNKWKWRMVAERGW